MKKQTSHLSRRHIIQLCVVISLIIANRVFADDIQVYVIAPRSLYEALRILESDFQTPITYEEPPYTIENTQPLFEGSAAIIPKRHALSFCYNREEGLETAIQTLLDSYHQYKEVPRYSLVKSNDPGSGFHVQPTSYFSASGLTQYKSPLTNQYGLTVTKDSTIGPFCAELYSAISSRVPYKVYFSLPNNVVGNDNLVIITQEVDSTGYAFLDMLASSFNSKKKGLYSWSWLRSPKIDDAVLSIYQLKNIKHDKCIVRITGQRPLLFALSYLSETLGLTIGYEDPPYLCPCEFHSNTDGSFKVPRGGILTYSFNPTNNPYEIVKGLVEAYNAQNNPGVFTATSLYNNCFSVYPTHGRDVDSSIIDINALSLVELKPESQCSKTSLLSVLSDSADAKVIMDESTVDVSNIYSHTNTTMRFDQFLSTTILRSGGKSWRILFDPSIPGYVVEFSD